MNTVDSLLFSDPAMEVLALQFNATGVIMQQLLLPILAPLGLRPDHARSPAQAPRQQAPATEAVLPVVQPAPISWRPSTQASISSLTPNCWTLPARAFPFLFPLSSPGVVTLPLRLRLGGAAVKLLEGFPGEPP